jgi:hypothetical protein
VFQCDLRIEKSATLYFELRDDANPYHVGPSLWIHRDGTIKANGQEIGKMPVDKWVRFTVECGLGAKADGKYNLKMSVPGEEAREFADLSCDMDFRQLAWLGYSSMGDERQVFYLDNFNLQVQ